MTVKVCAAHKKQSETRYTFVNSALSHFTKGFVLRNPFSDELLDSLHAVSAVWGSGAYSTVPNRK